MPVYVGDEFRFTQDGREFVARVHHDDCMGAPWEEHDGHCPVTRVSHDYGTQYGHSKKPGEFVFHRGNRGEYSYCVDMPECIALAMRDGWGIPDDDRQRFVSSRGREPTKRETAMIAVNLDLEFLRGWCADEWEWICLEVCAIVTDEDGEESETYCETLGGVESCGDYARNELMPELAENIIHRMQADEAKAREESDESAYWASRDVVTVGR